MQSRDELTSILTALPFYEKLTKVEQSMMLQNTRKCIYKKGELVYSGSVHCLGVLVILQGSMRAHLLSDDGKDITLYRLSDGDVCILSASCLLKDITFDINITAETQTVVYLIPATVYDSLLHQNIYVENYTYQITTEKFSDVMWSMEQILFRSFDERLAIFLLDESKKQKSTHLTLTHGEIAAYVGSAREVVSRMLKYFEKEGIVKLSRGEIELTDPKKLQQIIQK